MGGGGGGGVELYSRLTYHWEIQHHIQEPERMVMVIDQSRL